MGQFHPLTSAAFLSRRAIELTSELLTQGPKGVPFFADFDRNGDSIDKLQRIYPRWHNVCNNNREAKIIKMLEVDVRGHYNRTGKIPAAIMADSLGGVSGEGEAGQGGAYNGGLENYPQFHEKWTGKVLTYRGSFVSLGRPEHVKGLWVYGSPYYEAPNRNWDYETAFNDAANLPPLTPRFVYLRQELFVREYEQQT